MNDLEFNKFLINHYKEMYKLRTLNKKKQKEINDLNKKMIEFKS
jgi:hypothetical protein